MKLKKIIMESLTGFIIWTILLSPYMIFVVKTTFEQYVSWVGMQAILVPLIAPIVFRITKKVEIENLKKDIEELEKL